MRFMKKNIIEKAHLKKYFEITKEALIIAKKSINEKKSREAEIVIDMAERYYDDAKFFEDKKDYINAFAALNYSHGWIDAGSKLGLFDVNDSSIFVLK